MITDKESLAFYLAADKFALGRKRKHPKLFSDEIWKFQILLRKCEYFKNTNNNWSLHSLVTRFRFHKMSVRLGFDIPMNVFGPGMKINHRGTLVINGNSRIGKWCDMHPGVCVGDNPYATEKGEKVSNVPLLGIMFFWVLGQKYLEKLLLVTM